VVSGDAVVVGNRGEQAPNILGFRWAGAQTRRLPRELEPTLGWAPRGIVRRLIGFRP
jgi:hypothetical protein